MDRLVRNVHNAERHRGISARQRSAPTPLADAASVAEPCVLSSVQRSMSGLIAASRSGDAADLVPLTTRLSSVLAASAVPWPPTLGSACLIFPVLPNDVGSAATTMAQHADDVVLAAPLCPRCVWVNWSAPCGIVTRPGSPPRDRASEFAWLGRGPGTVGLPCNSSTRDLHHRFLSLPPLSQRVFLSSHSPPCEYKTEVPGHFAALALETLAAPTGPQTSSCPSVPVTIPPTPSLVVPLSTSAQELNLTMLDPYVELAQTVANAMASGDAARPPAASCIDVAHGDGTPLHRISLPPTSSHSSSFLLQVRHPLGQFASEFAEAGCRWRKYGWRLEEAAERVGERCRSVLSYLDWLRSKTVEGEAETGGGWTLPVPSQALYAAQASPAATCATGPSALAPLPFLKAHASSLHLHITLGLATSIVTLTDLPDESACLTSWYAQALDVHVPRTREREKVAPGGRRPLDFASGDDTAAAHAALFPAEHFTFALSLRLFQAQYEAAWWSTPRWLRMHSGCFDDEVPPTVADLLRRMRARWSMQLVASQLGTTKRQGDANHPTNNK